VGATGRTAAAAAPPAGTGAPSGKEWEEQGRLQLESMMARKGLRGVAGTCRPCSRHTACATVPGDTAATLGR